MNSFGPRLISFALCIIAATPNCYAQWLLEQDFDGVTAPALPNGWLTASLSGSPTQSATTSTIASNTLPNAALLVDPATSSDTALVSPELEFSGGAADYELRISFFHKRGMESSFDAGVLELSLDGAAYVDITDPSLGGVFDANGYNFNAIIGNTALLGRPGWSGTSTSFEHVVATLPALPAGVPFRLRFRLASDSSISGSGWYIDDIALSATVDLAVEVLPSKTQVKAGQEIDFVIRVLNPSSVAVPGAQLFISTPAGEVLKDIVSPSNMIVSFGDWFKVVNITQPIPPFGSADVTLTAETLPVIRSSAVLHINQALDTSFVGGEAGISFLSSSVPLPGDDLADLPVLVSSDSLCTIPPGPIPPEIIGSLVVAPSTPACSLGQSALTAQQGGAAAFLRLSTDTPPPPPAMLPSAYVDQPATAGLSIPAFSVSFISVVGLGPVLSAPGVTTHVELSGKKSEARGTFVLNVSNQAPFDPNHGNNLVASVVEVYLDRDNDGSADDIDECPSDAAKITAGACGCGLLDVDGNFNGVADCLLTEDYRASTELLKTLIKQLRVKKYKKQRALRKQIRQVQAALLQQSSNAGILVASTKVKLTKLARKLKKPVRKLVRSTQYFASNKKQALKALRKLAKGLA